MTETEQIEYKRSISELKEGIISIAAILNKHRKGFLYIDSFKNSEFVVRMPEIIDTKNTVVVKIFSPKEMLEENLTQIQTDTDRTQIRHKWILEYLREHKFIKPIIVR